MQKHSTHRARHRPERRPRRLLEQRREHRTVGCGAIRGAASVGARRIGAGSAAAAAGTTIALADSSLGKIIVDATGMTLYMFKPDDGQAAPTCADGCIDKWPALIADSPTAGDGLDASKLSTVARADGRRNQVKYGDYFLYTFANDKARR